MTPADQQGNAFRSNAWAGIVAPTLPSPPKPAPTTPAQVLANLAQNVNADFLVSLAYIIGLGNQAMYTYSIWVPGDLGHRLAAACTAAGGTPPTHTPSGGIVEPIPPVWGGAT